MKKILILLMFWSCTTTTDLLVYKFNIKILTNAIAAVTTANSNGKIEIDTYVVKPISGTPILPTTSPDPGTRSNKLSLTAAGGEFEPASFLLKSTAGVRRLTLTPSDLVGPLGIIPVTNINIRVVKTWFQGYYAWDNIGKGALKDFRQTLVPELLLKDDGLVVVDHTSKKNFVRLDRGNGVEYVWVNIPNLTPKDYKPPRIFEFPVKDADSLQPIDLEPGLTKQIWVTVHVPPGTAAGNYSGIITLNAPSANLGEIKIKLEVLPFNLAKSRLLYTIYYRGLLNPSKAAISSEYKNKVQMEAELINMRDHGIANPSIYQDTVDSWLFQQVLSLRESVEISNKKLFLLGVTTYYVDPSNTLKIREAIKMSKKYGAEDIYIYGRDEAVGLDLTNQVSIWQQVRDAGGKLFVAGYTGHYELVGSDLDILVHSGKPIPAEAVKWQSVGHKIFSYNNPQTPPENPFTFRRNYGVVLWGAGYDGAMPYAYQHCGGSCYNDLDDSGGSYRDHMFTYPTTDGVIDTIAWEGFREAVDDVRYLTTLEESIAFAYASHDTRLIAAANAAQIYLDKLRLSVLPMSSSKYTENFNIDLDDMRRSVINHIMTLKEL